MKKLIKLINVLAVTLLITMYSCDKDEEIIITLQNLEVGIDENPTNGQVIGTILSSNNSSLTFNIDTQSPSGALTINTTSGELTVADATLFDFETNPTITATVSADKANNDAIVTITLNNVNELSTQNFTTTIDENPTNGQSIGVLQANGDGTLSYSINTQSPAGALAINANTGELTVADATLFDFETNSTITANIAVDNSGNVQNITATITLNDVNELSLQDFSITIDENPTDGQIIGTVQSSGGTATGFSITSQAPNGALNVDANTGELSVADPTLFDFETNPTITATVSANGSLNTASITINLNDIDEIVAQDVNLTINENPSNGDIIGSLQATSGSNLTYIISSQNPAGAFTINQNTGEISVADATLFDYETNPNMLATISISNGSYSVSKNAFVALNDVHEVGEFKFGGVIFWIDPSSNNSSGLVCAITDQGIAKWGCSNLNITGANGTVIGTGESNTLAIVTNCSETGIAASLTSDLSLNGYNDWFLPSKFEIDYLYSNRNVVNTTISANGGTLINSGSYWSSSQNGSPSTRAWYRDFSNGGASTTFKVATLKVRAIRAWTD